MTRRRNRKSPSFPKPGERQQLFAGISLTREGRTPGSWLTLPHSFRGGSRPGPLLSCLLLGGLFWAWSATLILCVRQPEFLCFTVSAGSYFCHCVIADVSCSLGHLSVPVFLSLLFSFAFCSHAFFSVSLIPAASKLLLLFSAAPVFSL